MGREVPEKHQWLSAPWKRIRMCAKLTALENIAASAARNLQKAAMNLLSFTTIQQRDFSQQISVRASRVLGLISRHHVGLQLPASRQGLAVGLLRVLCNGTCTTRRFHTDDEPDRLSHYYEPLLLSNIFGSLWRNADFHPRENHKLYDLSTQVLHRGLQHGIAVMGFIDSFVYVHNYHRQNVDNLEDCMEGRIRLVTAITQHMPIRTKLFA